MLNVSFIIIATVLQVYGTLDFRVAHTAHIRSALKNGIFNNSPKHYKKKKKNKKQNTQKYNDYFAIRNNNI
jgi:transcriptional accessory protein Tex/SPT6